MSKRIHAPYSLATITILIVMNTIPAYAEVTELQTDPKTLYRGESITFTGKVEPNSSGLVTIVIRDLNDQFVMLTQAVTDERYYFEKTIQTNEKFTEHGIYSATGFIQNMTAEVTTSFGVSTNGVPLVLESEELHSDEGLFVIEEDVIEEEDVINETITVKKASFVDSTKDSQHYLDRYYSEPEYRAWFDRNYPDITIEEAVGFENGVETTTENRSLENKIIPEAEAISMVQQEDMFENNSHTAQMVLAIGGLGILFGAVYGVKKKVDNNSRQISINKDIIKKRILDPLRGSNPSQILQTRLARGEITLEEYEKLEKKITKN